MCVVPIVPVTWSSFCPLKFIFFNIELCANRDQSVSHIHGYYINYNCLIDQALLDQSNSMNVVELDYVWTSVSRLAMLDKAYVELEVRQI